MGFAVNTQSKKRQFSPPASTSWDRSNSLSLSYLRNTAAFFASSCTKLITDEKTKKFVPNFLKKNTESDVQRLMQSACEALRIFLYLSPSLRPIALHSPHLHRTFPPPHSSSMKHQSKGGCQREHEGCLIGFFIIYWFSCVPKFNVGQKWGNGRRDAMCPSISLNARNGRKAGTKHLTVDGTNLGHGT